MSDNSYVADLPLWSDKEAKDTLINICDEHKIPLTVFEDLIQLQRSLQSKDRRRGIHDMISEILDGME
jgi:hypothetical protein